MEIEGLTGEIRFNDDGRRQNYTLHVVEMTVNSAMVKVSFPTVTCDYYCLYEAHTELINIVTNNIRASASLMISQF